METNTIATLRALSVGSIANETTIYVKGYFSPGDGGGGMFIYLSAGTQTDDGGIYIEPTSGSGVWRRIYSGSVSVAWFGALGNELNPEGTYIQNAIDYVHNTSGYGEVLFPPAWYKIDVNLVTYADITLKGFGNAYLFRKGSIPSAQNFITINPCPDPSNWVHSKIALEGLMICGDESFSAPPSLSYKVNLTALHIKTNSFHIKNCAFYGFDRTTKFDTDSYLVSFNECSFRQNNYGFYYDYTGLSNSGENIKILDSVIGNNNVGLYNNLGNIYLNNCSIDYNVAHVGTNISKNGGVVSSPMVLDNCYIETHYNTSSTTDRFTNSGVMILNNCTIVDTFTGESRNEFNNTGELILTNNTFVIGEGKYMVLGNGRVVEANSTALSGAHIARINELNSGIVNNSFDNGLNGWTIIAGSSATTSTSNTYDSSHSLEIRPTSAITGTYLQSDRIAVPLDRSAYIVTAFVTNASTSGVIVVNSYDKNGTFLHAISGTIPATVTPVRVKLQEALVANTASIAIEVRCFNGSTSNAIYVDDFYLSFNS